MTQATFLAAQFKPGIARPTRDAAFSERQSRRVLLPVVGLLFVVSATVTALWCSSMEAMSGMPLPGGWTMSMTWMRMPGQTWAGATASFLAMWVVMMAAMMLPSLFPMLLRYRQVIDCAAESRLERLTAIAGLGYFFVWTLLGLAVFPAGVVLATIEMKIPALARTVPATVGVVVLLAGALQFTRWKARQLACCREAPSYCLRKPANDGTAWRQGLRFGLHCSLSCANLTVILLVTGVMDLRAMAFVTAAITAERLAPSGKGTAQAIGLAILLIGLILTARAIRFT